MDEELQEMIEGFVEDCREGFESMEEDLMAMEENPDNPSIMNNLFRVMHTLKGTAGFMGLNDIQAFSHKIESVFDLIREGKLELTPKLLDFLLPSIDKLKALVFGQVGECDIPDIGDDLVLLEKIIQDCSDSIISDDPLGAAEEAPADTAQEAPAKNVEPEVEPPQPAEEEIDFDAIMNEFGENVPQPVEDSPIVSTPEPEIPPPPMPNMVEEIDIPPLQTAPPEGSSAELLQQFVIEAEEHLEVIEESLLALDEESTDEEQVNAFFRAVHSIKGTAGYVQLKQVEAISHRIETIFDQLRRGDLKYSKEIGDVVFKSIDMLRTMVFYIKIEDYSQPVDISSQLRLLAGIAEGDSPKAAPVEVAPQKDDSDKLKTFLSGAQQQMEVLGLYRDELKNGPLDEHDLITLHRSLKTLNAGAKYCELVSLEAAITEYEEMLLKVLGGELEQTQEVIEKTVRPAHQKVIEEVAVLQNSDSPAPQIEKVEAVPTPAPTPAPVAAKPPEPPKAEPPEEEPAPAPPPAVPAPEEVKEMVPVVTETSKAQHRAARKITNQVDDDGAGGKGNTSEAKTMRVDASRLDRFMNLVSELIIARNAFKHLAETMDEERTVNEIIHDIKQLENSISRISDNLQDNLMEMRLVQVKTIFQRMPRIVRDISRKTNKKINLQMVGENTEVDKSIVEEIGDPLVHIIRNSCDHGVEQPDVRVAAGKPENGTITLKAGHMGSFIAIDIIDDGGGIDPEKIRRIAVSKGVISSEESEQMTDGESLNLIFAPGFSTAEQVSDISGRGVGMDVVMSNIRNIQGTVEVNSRLGEGTQVRLKLPLTLAVIEALIVGVNNTSFAIPLDAIKETVQIEKNAIKTLKDRSAIEIRGEILGVTPLTELLDLSVEEIDDDNEEILEEEELNKEKVSVVILNVNEREIGIAVDRLFNQQEVVVKPLEDYLSSIPGLKGSTIMGDGQVVLILEPNELMELATSSG